MTEEEKSGIVHEVIETIKGQSQDITELPLSDNIEDFTTLPAVGRDGRLKKFRVTDLRSEFAGGSNIELVQETGQSEDKAMSQKATTAAITAATTTTDGKNLQEVYDATKSLTRTGQPSATIDIAQELGEAADKPISQKAVSAVIAEIEKKARDNAEAIASMSASGGVPIAQEAGDSATKVMSQAAVTEYVKNSKKKKTYTKVKELQTNKEEVFDVSLTQGSKIRLTVRGSNSVNLGIIYSDSARHTIANGDITDPSVYEFVLEKDMLQISLWTGVQTSITVEKEVMSPLLSEEDIAQTLSDTSSNKALGANLGEVLVEQRIEWTNVSREEIRNMIHSGLRLQDNSGAIIADALTDIIVIPVKRGEKIVIEKPSLWNSSEYEYGAAFFKNSVTEGVFASKAISTPRTFFEKKSVELDVPNYANFLVFNVTSRGATKFDLSQSLEIKRLVGSKSFVNGKPFSDTILNSQQIDVLRDKALRLNEAATLSLQQERKNIFIKGVLLETWDIPLTLANYKVFIDAMQSAKLNFLIYDNNIRWSDSTINVDKKTYELVKYEHGLTEDELVELSSYAHDRGVELCLRGFGPGHIDDGYTRKYPEIVWSAGNLDISSETGRNFGLAVLKKYCELAQRCGLRYHHISADEWGGQTGFTDAQENGTWGYADYINMEAELCTTYGLIPMVWNDPICCNDRVIPRINKNISVCVYNDKNMNRGVAGIDTLQREGYNFLINSSTEIYYNLGGVPRVSELGMRAFDIHRFYGNQIMKKMPQGTLWCIWPFDTTGYTAESALGKLLPLLAIYGEVVNKQLKACNVIEANAIAVSSGSAKQGMISYVDINIPEGFTFGNLISGNIDKHQELQVYSVTNLTCEVDSEGRWSSGSARLWFANTSVTDVDIHVGMKVILNFC